MFKSLSRLVDKLSEFLAPRKGLLPLIGMLLVCLNFIFRFLPSGWIRETDLFLHLGLVIAIFGLMLAWAL
jgi:TRAP-type mannitol/chloroaromatic compound transport system permease small subunit